jgi:tagatose-6-phosphate ketose/aldose isomerase
MEYFKITEGELTSLGALHTAKEIWDQPSVWAGTYEKFSGEKREIKRFRDEALGQCRKIILTGAGTSAYIGHSLEGVFQRHTGITTVSIPTTHLVTHPGDYLDPDLPVLVVSFARSGNSPESVAAVKRIDQICGICAHLVITCDQEGLLARYESRHNKFNFVLPPESNDKSLAMTSSYTGMMLAGLLFARFDQLGSLKDQVARLVDSARKIITQYGDTLKQIAALDFERAVFLGSGPLYGTSMESGLKLQELTDGTIICKNDSFMGFRHGPKAVVNEKTIVMFLLSNNEIVQRYEKDLVRSMQRGKRAMKLIGVSENPVNGIELDSNIVFGGPAAVLDEEFLAICSVLPAQMLGLFKSLALGLKPDNPSVSGAISRVVEGVVIYDDELA